MSFRHQSFEEAEAEDRIAEIGFVATEKRIKELEERVAALEPEQPVEWLV
jgi:hypothetical protein